MSFISQIDRLQHSPVVRCTDVHCITNQFFMFVNIRTIKKLFQIEIFLLLVKFSVKLSFDHCEDNTRVSVLNLNEKNRYYNVSGIIVLKYFENHYMGQLTRLYKFHNKSTFFHLIQYKCLVQKRFKEETKIFSLRCSLMRQSKIASVETEMRKR